MKLQAKDIPLIPSPGVLNVTLDDNNDFVGFSPDFPRAFIPDRDGTVKVTSWDGNVGTVPVKTGLIYPIQCKRFWSTGTTSGMVLTAIH